MKTLALALTMLFVASPAMAKDVPFGAVSSEPLVRGGLAVYGLAGYPGLRVGFRQGYRELEVGAEAGFDYVSADFFATVTGRRSVITHGAFNLSLDAKLGAFADAGARWSDNGNRSGAGLRFEVGSSLSYRTSWPLRWLAFVKVPTEIPFADGNFRVAGLLGGGAEVSLTPDYFIALNGAFGPDYRSHMVQTTRLTVEAMVGFGYRVF